MTRTEKILLAVTGAFFLLALAFLPRGGTAARETETVFERPGPGPAAAEGPEEALWVTVEKRIDLNHAPAEELTALTGVGRVTAAAIVAYRESHGPFASVEELLLVPGLGETTLNAILASSASVD